jgi:hypothetical protein
MSTLKLASNLMPKVAEYAKRIAALHPSVKVANERYSSAYRVALAITPSVTLELDHSGRHFQYRWVHDLQHSKRNPAKLAKGWRDVQQCAEVMLKRGLEADNAIDIYRAKCNAEEQRGMDITAQTSQRLKPLFRAAEWRVRVEGYEFVAQYLDELHLEGYMHDDGVWLHKVWGSSSRPEKFASVMAEFAKLIPSEATHA